MRSPSARTPLWVAVAVMVFGLVACGDDDATDPAPGDDTAATTTDDATTADATTDPAPGDDTATDEPAVTTTETVLPPGDADPVFCGEVAEALQELDALLEGGGAGPAGDDDLRQRAGEIFDDIDAPDEIAEDWELLMEPLTGPPPEVPDPNDPDAIEAFAEQQQAYQDAAVRVEAYLRERCELDRGLLSGAPAPPEP
jgi:hypothetical protein